MESFVRINVAKAVGGRFKHFFDVDVKPSRGGYPKEIYNALKARFPSPEYKIDCTKWECKGTETTYDD